MDRIKSFAITTLGVVIALAGLGLFASVGLAVVGTLVILGAVTAFTASIAAVFAKRATETPEAA